MSNLEATANTPAAGVLADLLERVEKAEGPDRELDVALHALDTKRGRIPVSQTRYTASLDAALALAGRMAPGRRIMLWQDISDDDWGAHFRSPNTDTAYAATPALAVVGAVLKVLLDPRWSPA